MFRTNTKSVPKVMTLKENSNKFDLYLNLEYILKQIESFLFFC